MGVAGVDGNGQRELAEAIAGQRHVADGDIRLFGHSIARFKVAQREKLGLRYVTDDRLHEGTVGSLSVAMNVVLKQIGKPPFWVRGRIRYAAIVEKAREVISRYEIRTPSPETRVAALSGGNVQKVVLARELSFDPKVVIYSKPTYGLDVKTTRSVRQTIRDQAAGRCHVDRPLHGPRRAARSLRPHRGGVARPHRRRRRQRPGRPAAGGRADGRRGRPRERDDGRRRATRRPRPEKSAGRPAWLGRVGRLPRALDPAARARARDGRDHPVGDRRRPDSVLQGRLVRGLRVRGLAGHGHAGRAAAAHRRRPDRGLQGRDLEPRHGRAVPACGGRDRRDRPAAGAPPAQRGQPRVPVPRRRRGRRGLDDRARTAEGALRAERDHHDADDELHRHQPRADPRQGNVPGPDDDDAADTRLRLLGAAAVDSWAPSR